jgi:hypothetical protein
MLDSHKLLILFVSLLLGMAACQPPAADAKNPLEGVWRIVEETRIRSNGETKNSKPQPSLYIFTDHHYSAVLVLSNEPRSLFAEAFRPTDAEKVAAYDSIVVNTGTYELTDSTMTTHPIVARIPNFMGGSASYEYEVENDTLWLKLVDEYSREGVQYFLFPDTQILKKLVRIE